MNTGAQAGRLAARAAHHRGVAASAGDASYALEGSAFIAGAAVQWLRDGLGLISERRRGRGAGAQRCRTSGGVVFVPALAGLGAPHWRPRRARR